MNPFFFVILFALLLEYAIGVAANLLNLKSLRSELPPGLEGVYQPENYRKSQEYIRTNTRFDFITSTFSLVVLLFFWFAGGFNDLDQIVRSSGFTPVLNGLFYIGILLIGYSLLTLPFSIYHTFVIEERFGFNRTTRRTFLIDRIKGLGLAVLIGAALLSGILALFEYVGYHAWIYCWIAVTVFSLILEYVAPTWIMPLFNKFTPLEPGELKEAIFNYASSVDFPIKNVSVMDGSKRSSKSNAFFTGFGHNKRIALYDTLIEKHTVPELVAVLAHEIGHHKKKHILQGTIINIIHFGVLFFVLSIFLGSSGLYDAFYMEQQSVYSGILFFGLLYTPLEMVLSVVMNALSRKNEYEADRFAAETIEQPHHLTEALKKLYAGNLSNLMPHPFYVFLSYSHPPLLQRIRAILRYEA
ncbi:MAG: M48 family metallopeptidase [Dehalococcoidia bacterium]|nr:M48 family metallopeptidase [Dehalococcoidia bacterium]